MNKGEAGPSTAALPPSLLAPGFRFHPTDEELVIYYLKRKVSGRLLRVDAIGELDLYKCEPWDLPALSHLRSRDREWYFFSSLDRKYANRSRTNRATAQGYWKTTGKDRPVHHAGRIVGMKKTLVFHDGRAPRGQRTNWVMHEYRLEDPLFPQPQVPQDAYVVCRIFQKSGSGPQNGAQYGAPFVEEEWEEEEGDYVVPQGENCELMEALDQDYLQMIDFKENANPVNQQENTALLTRGTVEQNGDGQLMEPTILMEDILNEHSLIDDVDAYINMPEGDDQLFINDVEENTGMGQTEGSLTQSDGFVELNDLLKTDNASTLSDEDIIGSPLWIPTDLPNDANGSSILPDMNGGEEFFDFVNENLEQMEPFQMSPAVPDDICQQPNNFLNPASGDYPSRQSTEDNLTFFDALGHELGQENFTQMNDLLYSPMDNPSGFDIVDEYMAFFDATDANLHYASLDSLEKSENADSCNFGHSNFAQQVDGGSIPTTKASAVASSSSARLPSVDHSSSGENVDGCGAPEVPGNENWDKPLTKRLVNMLGSISSPPALAAEFPAKAVNQFALNSANQGGSIHVTAGMIHIRSSAVTASGEHWSVQKNGSVGFLLSYGMAGNGSKPVALEPTTKVHGGALTVVLRGWFYFFFFSALFLAASFRIGVCIYSK